MKLGGEEDGEELRVVVEGKEYDEMYCLKKTIKYSFKKKCLLK